tara:strand:- start:37 stop:939 length:903 start_codon:yes stop_codon:yes gene_type:complete
MKKNNVHGILLLDKPKGITSNKTLQKIKSIYNAKKAGHCGTLDPLATGLLPICFGNATKTIPYFMDSSKTYNVLAKLGEKTTTGDAEGEIINLTDGEIKISSEKLNTVLSSFLGITKQIPPMHSALKVNGKPLYKLAHKGKSIDRKPRNITIHQIHLNSFSGKLINLTVSCSKGTYIRTLIEDIALKLQTFGYVKELRRISIDVFRENEMIPYEEILGCKKNKLSSYLKPIDYGLMHLASISINHDDFIRFSNGQTFTHKTNFKENKGIIRIYDSGKIFIGLGNQQKNDLIQPLKVFTNN